MPITKGWLPMPDRHSSAGRHSEDWAVSLRSLKPREDEILLAASSQGKGNYLLQLATYLLWLISVQFFASIDRS
ncbi:MAG: hypothetical protein LVR00_09675 [Rhabdochlamydiaceae bacterium]